MPGVGIWRTKSVEQSIADTDEPSSRLRRELTAKDLTVFGVAVVVGAGIFTLTARTAGNVAGPSVSLAFVLAAIACGLAALCYAEFASAVPVAGSAYTFSYATFGEFVAWIIGWDLILEFALASAVVAKGWSLYLGGMFGGESSIDLGPISVDWGALLIVGVLTVVLAIGTKISSRVSAVVTAIKVAVVLLVIVVGIFYIDKAKYAPYVPEAEESAGTATGVHQSLFSALTGAGGSSYGWYGLLAAASLVFFAFIGFDVVATTAEETKNPQKALPRGILGSLAIVTVLYVGVTLVLTGMVKYTDLKTGSALVGDGSATLATAFEAHGVAWAQMAINIGTLFAFVLVCVGVMVLRRTRPDLPRGFRVPLVPLVPVLAVLACAWLMLNLSVETWIRFAAWMALGVAIYFAYGRRKSVLGQRLELEASRRDAEGTERREPEPV
ncbi:amino acid permease [Rhodococcus sp. NPDC047139]|uniref:APC family permease n=1 Tax=Rhodococcus sp. NPDC047139 TaxID=3155141 RepID=UPI0033EBD8E3